MCAQLIASQIAFLLTKVVISRLYIIHPKAEFSALIRVGALHYPYTSQVLSKCPVLSCFGTSHHLVITELSVYEK